jgi:hypothetical protein
MDDGGRQPEAGLAGRDCPPAEPLTAGRDALQRRALHCHPSRLRRAVEVAVNRFDAA